MFIMLPCSQRALILVLEYVLGLKSISLPRDDSQCDCVCALALVCVCVK